MAKLRPVKRLLNIYEPGQGKAQIVEKSSQLSHILFVASRGQLGRRNVAIVMMLFGSGLRINEVSQLKVSDVYSEDGSLKEIFHIHASYTKTGKSRLGYLLCKQQREALEIWKEQRISERAMISDNNKYNGLLKDSPLFLSKKGKSWRKFSFNVKKYKTKEATKETLVCSSLENMIRDIFKNSGLQGGSSHSGRRSLASMMERKGFDLELIQKVLGHENPDMTLEYIDPWEERLQIASKKIWKDVKLPAFGTLK